MKKRPYLSAIGSFRLKVVQGDQLPQQAALLVASLHSSQFEVRLRSLEDQSEVHSKPCHVYSKGPMGVKHSFPAVDLPCCIHFGGFVAQATDEGYWPHRHLSGAAHLEAKEREGHGGGVLKEGKHTSSKTPSPSQCPAGDTWGWEPG